MEARKLAVIQGKQEENPRTTKSTQEKVKNTLTEEIIIGICSPIGCDKGKVISYLKERLTGSYGYEFKIIKLSDFLMSREIDFTSFEFDRPKNCTKYYEKYLELIQKGNHLRNNYNNSILAELAVENIYTKRMESIEDQAETGFEKLKSRRICYLTVWLTKAILIKKIY